MTAEEIAQLLEKTASRIDELESENAELKATISRKEVVHASGETLDKLASAAGMDVDKTYETLKSLTDEQRQLFSKVASDQSFTLGEVSDFESVEEPSAEEKFVDFLMRG